MNFTGRWHSRLPRMGRTSREKPHTKPDAKINVARGAALLAALAISVAALAAWFALGDGVSAFSGAPTSVEIGAPTAAQAQGSEPEANLPYLFAVYIITWAAFFAYVFYVSRRQREMQAEIDALKRALEERKPSA